MCQGTTHLPPRPSVKAIQVLSAGLVTVSPQNQDLFSDDRLVPVSQSLATVTLSALNYLLLILSFQLPSPLDWKARVTALVLIGVSSFQPLTRNPQDHSCDEITENMGLGFASYQLHDLKVGHPTPLVTIIHLSSKMVAIYTSFIHEMLSRL